MELEGDMLDALDFKPTADGIKIGVFGSDAPKADGHNKLSGKTNNMPQRRFLPGEGQQYKNSIDREIDKIITDKIATDEKFIAEEKKKEEKKAEAKQDEVAQAVDFSQATFSAISSKADLSRTLNRLFPAFTRSEVVGIIGRNARLQRIFQNLNLIRFL